MPSSTSPASPGSRVAPPPSSGRTPRTGRSSRRATSMRRRTSPAQTSRPSSCRRSRPTSRRPRRTARRSRRSSSAYREALGDRLLVIRPGLIAGPGDASGRSGYWVARAARDDEPMLVPDILDAPVQAIHVDDLVRFTLDSIERRLTGAFNAVGERVTFGDWLEASRAVGGHRGEVVAVSPEWLAEQGVAEWSGPESLPLWIIDPEWSAFLDRSNAAATSPRGCDCARSNSCSPRSSSGNGAGARPRARCRARAPRASASCSRRSAAEATASELARPARVRYRRQIGDGCLGTRHPALLASRHGDAFARSPVAPRRWLARARRARARDIRRSRHARRAGVAHLALADERARDACGDPRRARAVQPRTDARSAPAVERGSAPRHRSISANCASPTSATSTSPTGPRARPARSPRYRRRSSGLRRWSRSAATTR